VVRPSRIGFFSELWRFNEFRMASLFVWLVAGGWC
jgi:hypothetical protein